MRKIVQFPFCYLEKSIKVQEFRESSKNNTLIN